MSDASGRDLRVRVLPTPTQSDFLLVPRPPPFSRRPGACPLPSSDLDCGSRTGRGGSHLSGAQGQPASAPVPRPRLSEVPSGPQRLHRLPGLVSPGAPLSPARRKAGYPSSPLQGSQRLHEPHLQERGVWGPDPKFPLGSRASSLAWDLQARGPRQGGWAGGQSLTEPAPPCGVDVIGPAYRREN